MMLTPSQLWNLVSAKLAPPCSCALQNVLLKSIDCTKTGQASGRKTSSHDFSSVAQRGSNLSLRGIPFIPWLFQPVSLPRLQTWAFWLPSSTEPQAWAPPWYAP